MIMAALCRATTTSIPAPAVATAPWLRVAVCHAAEQEVGADPGID
jgi:hypothetical protein